jgi:nucleotide-binding universal stress UspA family protein
MFKNVLVGIDGTLNGRDAIALASRLLDADGELTLAHVHTGEFHPLHAVTPGLLAEERKVSAALLQRERDAADIDARLVSVIASSPGRGLHGQAEEQGADLIVVGSCSRGLLGRAMLGDDTRGALNGAPCAVAVAAGGFAASPKPIVKIGVGYDESPESQAALETARGIAKSLDASVIALQVATVPPVMFTGLVPPLVEESVDVLVEEAKGRMAGLPDVEGRAVHGVPSEELAAFGDELDLLIVGSRNYGPARRLVVGSTSNYLERHARCSLLTLPRVGSEATTSESTPVATTAGV